MSNHSLWIPFEHSKFSFILQTHSSIKLTSKICPLSMPFSGDFHCRELHGFKWSHVFFDWQSPCTTPTIITSEASKPIWIFCTLRKQKKLFSWAFQAGHPSPLVSLSLVHCVFSYAYHFQVSVTQAMLELAKSCGSLIYWGAVTRRDSWGLWFGVLIWED